MCSPQKGDGYIVSAWLHANGYGTEWNDAPGRDRDEVLFLLKGLDLTDDDFEKTFGPNWKEWADLVRLFARSNATQLAHLAAAWDAARAAAWVAARAAAGDAAGDAARDAAWDAAWDAAGDAARAAAWDAAWDAAGDAARAAAGVAAWAALAPVGPRFSQEQKDLLMLPIVEVYGADWRELVK
jgi:hypothetical protein